MQGRPRQERSAGALIRRAIRIVAFTLVSAAALVFIGSKIRATWNVLDMLERRVDGMVASATHPGAPSLLDESRWV